MVALACGSVSTRAQAETTAAAAPPIAPQLRTQEELRHESLRLSRMLDEQPGVAVPLAVTVTGGVVGVGSLFLGALTLMGHGHCTGPLTNLV